MLKKSINTYSYLITGLFFIIIGFFSIFSDEELMRYILIILAIGIFVNAIINLVINIFKTKDKMTLIFKTILDAIFASFIFFKIDFVSDSLIVLFGIYLFFLSVFHFMNLVIYQINNVSGRLRILFNFIIDLILSLCLILQPNQSTKYAGIIIGIYLILYGFMGINDFICEIVPQKYADKIKMKIRIPLPIFLASFIPQRLISIINDSLKTNKDKSFLYVEKNNDSKNADLFVIIHLAKSGTATFGHVEIAFEDKIYSYGNYDRHSRMLFNGIGDGVILVADKKKYIEYQVRHQNRYLVEFGFKVTDDEKKEIRKRINKLITENTIIYHSDLELKEMGLIDDECNDMSSDLYKLADAKYYKIIKGKHKTFFVLKTNCVVVAEYILRSLGTFMPENGIIAPGTYYEYLNQEFMRKNSKVISRRIYTKDNI